MEDWRLNATYSGTPQGGILSPILANIYLHELDKKIEALQKEFAKGHDRAYSAAYSAANSALKKEEKRLQAAQTEEERQAILKDIHRTKVARRKLPYTDCTDKKISYVRYADDFLIGVKGNKEFFKTCSCGTCYSVETSCKRWPEPYAFSLWRSCASPKRIASKCGSALPCCFCAQRTVLSISWAMHSQLFPQIYRFMRTIC